MKRMFFGVLICSFLYEPFVVASAVQETYAQNPGQAVAAFQKLPSYEVDCRDETMGSTEPIKVGSKFENYLSKAFYKLFLWSQCVEPEIPPQNFDNGAISWDFRFGFHDSGGSDKVTNIHLNTTKFQGSDKATIKLLFDIGYLNNITTTYTLIREDGHWKIDDIAPKGDEPNEYNGDTALEHSDSIKADMQTNYNAAMKRYQQEQAKLNSSSK